MVSTTCGAVVSFANTYNAHAYYYAVRLFAALVGTHPKMQERKCARLENLHRTAGLENAVDSLCFFVHERWVACPYIVEILTKDVIIREYYRALHLVQSAVLLS